jgi:hypothetical protein
MKTMKKYNQFIFEADDSERIDLGPESDNPGGDYSDIRDDLREMVEKSLKTSDKETIKDFISAFVRNPEETQIEGLINDSDVYDFYLKYRNDIDEILSKVNFYDEVPSEMSCFSLYDYVIRGTKKSVEEIVRDLEESGPETETETEIE